MSTHTPWGRAQTSTKIARGITRYDTASHGGYKISEGRFKELSRELQSYVPFAGRLWYEEDCDWCIIPITWPEFFEKKVC